MKNKPKCFGDIINTAGCGICGDCSEVLECEKETKNKIYLELKKEHKNGNV